MTVTQTGDLDPLTLEERLSLARRLPPPQMRKALRQSAGLSGTELAAAIGVTRQALAHWESGTRYPRPAQLRRYVQVLEQLSKATA